jgi:hypothetical protein
VLSKHQRRENEDGNPYGDKNVSYFLKTERFQITPIQKRRTGKWPK